MKKIKKSVAILLVYLLILMHVLPTVVLAEEVADLPVEEPGTESQSTESQSTESESTTENNTETQVNNQAEVTNEVDSTATSGDNSIEEPVPTPVPAPTQNSEVIEEDSCQTDTATDCSSGEAEQTSTEQPEATSSATPEINVKTNPEATPSATESTIETEDAVSFAEVENSVNTTEINSQVVYQTLNIFVSQDIDLSINPLTIAQEFVVDAENNDPVVNVSVTDINNIAYLSNDIISVASTGENSINGSQDAVIDTGDAYSIVSLLNKVNTTITDSTIHIITINIFGDVQGNILLPELSPETEGTCCGESSQINNTAVLENEAASSAVSGQNTIVADDASDASINTGTALSIVNLTNIVNTNLIGVVFYRLVINTLGTWIGNFLGWDGFTAAEGGDSLVLSSTNTGNNADDCPTCTGDISIENESHVTNNVSSIASSGGNYINGNGGNINTGRAFSAVSIFNFVNTSIIRSVGFLGSINIFGALRGNIGGASLFETTDPEPEANQENTAQDQGEEESVSVREEGGALTISQHNNVGTHVLPGDTVTFFINIKNTGTGKVYDAVLDLGLIKDGVDMGGGTFKIGEIKAGEGVKISTGLVLSKDAVLGDYTARAKVSGYVGADNDLISASADSYFKIAGYSPWSSTLGTVEGAQAIEPREEILGAVTKPAALTLEQKVGLLILFMLALYLPVKAYQKREELSLAFSRSKGFLAIKSAAIRSLLMSLFIWIFEN